VGIEEKGKTAKIQKLLKSKNRVVLENLNMVKKAMKPSSSNQAGGIIDKSASLHCSNILLFCSSCSRGVRTKRGVDSSSGSRLCSKCNKLI
jgi:large subunit ribosomal protein L24